MSRVLRATVPAAAALAAMAVAIPAYAQLAQPTQRPGRPVRGLFANGSGNVGQQLVLNVSFGGGYDWDKGLDVYAGPNVPPVVFPSRTGRYGTGSLGLNYDLTLSRITAGVFVGTNARYQPNQPTKLATSAGAGANVGWQLTSTTSLAASLAISRQPHNQQLLFGSWMDPGSAPDVLYDLSGATAQSNYLTSQTSVSASQRVYRRISLTAQYGYHEQGGWFGGPTARSTTHTASAGIGYQIFRGARLHASYGTTSSRFGPTGTPVRNSGLLADGGLDFGRALSLTRRMTLGFSTGVSGARDEFNHVHYLMTGRASLSYEIGRSWTANFNVRRGVDFNQGFGQPVVIDTASLALGGNLNRRMQLSSGAGFSSGTVGVGSGARGYTAANGRVSVRTAMTRTMGVSVFYSYGHHEFDDPASLPAGLRPEISRHTVRISLDLWVPLITRARSSDASR